MPIVDHSVSMSTGFDSFRYFIQPHRFAWIYHKKYFCLCAVCSGQSIEREKKKMNPTTLEQMLRVWFFNWRVESTFKNCKTKLFFFSKWNMYATHVRWFLRYFTFSLRSHAQHNSKTLFISQLNAFARSGNSFRLIAHLIFIFHKLNAGNIQVYEKMFESSAAKMPAMKWSRAKNTDYLTASLSLSPLSVCLRTRCLRN